MITKPTVFVLGAGASMEYGFPSGWGLIQSICAQFQKNEIIQSLGASQEEIQAFAKTLSRSGKLSIDAFLEHRTDLIELGKKLIAAALIPCENEDMLFATGNSPGWYRLLFEKMNCPFDQFKNNKVKFVTYNYDRSLEHFLTTALATSYRQTQEASHKIIVGAIDVIHVHGLLGKYETGSYQDVESRTYCKTLNQSSIRDAAKHIRIIHEELHEEADLKKATEILQWAEQIFFVGFGYDPINIARLEPHQWVRPGKIICGTAYGMTGDEQIQALRALTKGLSASDVSNVLESHRQAYSGIRLGDINLKFSNDGVNATDFIRELPWS